MIITIPWLKEHLKTKAKEKEIISYLTNIGLEVEGVKENSSEMGKFKTGAILVKWQELFDVKEQSISISGPLPLEEVSISSLLDDKTFTGEDFLLK